MNFIIPTMEDLGRFLGMSPVDARREKLKFSGEFDLVLYNENGRKIQHVHKKNLIVTTGLQLISDALFLNTSRPAVVGWIAVGTSNTAAALTDTALGAESGRVACTYSYASSVATIAATFPAGTATAALTEAGAFNAATAGTMLNRVTYAVINKGASDILTVNYQFTIS